MNMKDRRTCRRVCCNALALGTSLAAFTFGARAFAFDAPNLFFEGNGAYSEYVLAYGGQDDGFAYDNYYVIAVYLPSDGSETYYQSDPNAGVGAAPFYLPVKDPNNPTMYVAAQMRWSSFDPWEPHYTDWTQWYRLDTETRLDGTIQSYGNTCIDVPFGSGTPGTFLQNYQCLTGDANQRWSFYGPFGWFRAATSGNVLDVFQENNQDAVQVDLNPPDFAQDQAWTLANMNIVGIADKCVDVFAFGGAGAVADLWPCNGYANQVWTYSFGKIVGYGGNCLTSLGNEAGAGVVMEPCGWDATQQWDVFPGGLLSNRASSMCLDLPNFDINDGTPFVTSPCTGSTTQKFAWQGTIHSSAGQCLDLREGNLSNGTPIQVWDCLPNDLNQFWKFMP
jgi:hypothetical protein